MQSHLVLLAGVTFLLAACTQPEKTSPAPLPAPATPPAPPSDSAEPEPGVTHPSPELGADECGAYKIGNYVGQLPTTDAMARIKTAIGHDHIRTIKPGDAVTMDFHPDRLNIEVDEGGRIKVLRCG